MDPVDDMSKVAKQFTLEDIFGKQKRELKLDVDIQTFKNLLSHTDTHNRIVEQNEIRTASKKAIELDKKKEEAERPKPSKFRIEKGRGIEIQLKKQRRVKAKHRPDPDFNKWAKEKKKKGKNND